MKKNRQGIVGNKSSKFQLYVEFACNLFFYNAAIMSSIQKVVMYKYNDLQKTSEWNHAFYSIQIAWTDIFNILLYAVCLFFQFSLITSLSKNCTVNEYQVSFMFVIQ